ncbi:hypothetical protein NDU88_005597 [Pleurodeles waltl]|uniref:Uncharacterized protein n=1 Tax=Pleurodeles waltl TaxID=8319 RepID=A0AAV7TVA1_PLEWA|nr:hypothetical protein NDU88_005597 [Pleurodeles waltl]
MEAQRSGTIRETSKNLTCLWCVVAVGLARTEKAEANRLKGKAAGPANSLIDRRVISRADEPKLHFDSRKLHRLKDTEPSLQKDTEEISDTHGDSNLKPILAGMQKSLTSSEGKIDAFTYRTDRMTERLDKHADHLNGVERRISKIEDVQADGEVERKKMDMQLATLQARAEDFEERSRRNNLRIVGIAEGTRIENMECFMEQLL